MHTAMDVRGYPRLWLAELFFASLALINIRFSGISPPLVVGSLLILWELPRLVARSRTMFQALDVVVFFYLVLALLTFTPDNGPFALLKSVGYFAIFLALRTNLADASDLGRTLLRGVSWGSALFVLTLIFAFASGSLQLSDLTRFSYDTFTVNLYRQFVERSASGTFEGRDILRNSIAEVHSLYFVVAYNFGRLALCSVPVLAIFLFQSRRAFLVAAMSAFFSGGVDRRKIVVALIGLFVFGVYFYYASYLTITTRFAEFGSEGRMSQYREAWFWILQSPIEGYGYGEQVRDKYVHNFLLGSWFMMGIMGLALALLFLVALVPLSMGTGRHRWLLLIPAFDIFTGSNVEGILTFSSWTAIAVLCVLKYDGAATPQDTGSHGAIRILQPQTS